MGFQPSNMGHRVLEVSGRSGPTAGVLPFRAVILDASATIANVGDLIQAPFKHPSTTHTDDEHVVGVITGPVTENTLGSDSLAPASAWAALAYIAQNRAVNVRTQGIVPILCDDSTDSTGINPGDYVKASVSTTTSISSQTVTMAGCAAKATKNSSANDFAADQHIIGRSWSKVAPAANASLYALVELQPMEF
jgi:hypothetical protein